MHESPETATVLKVEVRQVAALGEPDRAAGTRAGSPQEHVTDMKGSGKPQRPLSCLWHHSA